jgi:hypothetical protein
VSFVYDLVVLAHLIGMAMIVGGWLAVRRQATVSTVMLWGARLQVITGLALVAMLELSLGVNAEPDHAKIGVKLVVALAVAGLAEMQARKRPASAGAVDAVGYLAILNVVVAVFV